MLNLLVNVVAVHVSFLNEMSYLWINTILPLQPKRNKKEKVLHCLMEMYAKNSWRDWHTLEKTLFIKMLNKFQLHYLKWMCRMMFIYFLFVLFLIALSSISFQVFSILKTERKIREVRHYISPFPPNFFKSTWVYTFLK